MSLTIKPCTHSKLNCLKKKYLHKRDLALNNLQRLICHKTNQPTTPKEYQQLTWFLKNDEDFN